MVRHNNVPFFFLTKSRPFVEKQSLIQRYKEAISGCGAARGTGLEVGRSLAGSYLSHGILAQMPG